MGSNPKDCASGQSQNPQTLGKGVWGKGHPLANGSSTSRRAALQTSLRVRTGDKQARRAEHLSRETGKALSPNEKNLFFFQINNHILIKNKNYMKYYSKRRAPRGRGRKQSTHRSNSVKISRGGIRL